MNPCFNSEDAEKETKPQILVTLNWNNLRKTNGQFKDIFKELFKNLASKHFLGFTSTVNFIFG